MHTLYEPYWGHTEAAHYFSIILSVTAEKLP